MREEKRRREEKKRKREKEEEIQVWNLYGIVWKPCVWIMYGNPFLSKSCRKNPIRSIVGWHKMSFMVYFEF